MSKADFDRSAEDVGNILQLEHVNLTVPDQGIAALFYVTGLGFTRDPYIDFGTRNMWVNLGAQQFHLPKADPQLFRGHISVVVPDLDDLKKRLDFITKPMAGSKFAWTEQADHLALRCPWGNDIRAYAPGRFSRMPLGMPEVTVTVPAATSAGICRFYQQVMRCPASHSGGITRVKVGYNQELVFAEGDQVSGYDGHHIAVYVADFSGPHSWLQERRLISEESDQHQYRFVSIVDPDSGEVLTELEHEVRSMSHAMANRPLVNRNPAVNFFTYQKGNEIFTPGERV
jgi:catechol 2,3-dioxygenase-like lactoylglutathione lyase family enzyme